MRGQHDVVACCPVWGLHIRLDDRERAPGDATGHRRRDLPLHPGAYFVVIIIGVGEGARDTRGKRVMGNYPCTMALDRLRPSTCRRGIGRVVAVAVTAAGAYGNPGPPGRGGRALAVGCRLVVAWWWLGGACPLSSTRTPFALTDEVEGQGSGVPFYFYFAMCGFNICAHRIPSRSGGVRPPSSHMICNAGHWWVGGLVGGGRGGP